MDIARLKSFAAEKLPQKAVLRDLLLTEKDRIQVSDFLARLPIYLALTPNSIAAVMYPSGADLDDALTSLNIITQDLQAKKNRRPVK